MRRLHEAAKNTFNEAKAHEEETRETMEVLDDLKLNHAVLHQVR